MKRLLLYFITVLAFSGCEDVIDVELDDPQPRLVVDALIRVNTELPSNRVSVRLAISSNFFEENTPVNDAEIRLSNLTLDQQTTLNLDDSNGTYSAVVDTDILTDGVLELQVAHNGSLYTAMNTFTPSTPITKLEQGDGELFGEDDIEIIIGYSDPGDQTNYYLIDYDQGEYFTQEDTFYQGQDFEFSYFHDSAKPGDTLEVFLMGANQELINYMDQVLTLSGEDGLTPFQTPVTPARGNIIGPEDDFENYTLGYFAVVEAFSQTLVIE